MRKKDGKYVCMVKGGHCIDITYYNPDKNLSKFYEEDQSYCHKRSCAKKTFRLGWNIKSMITLIDEALKRSTLF